MRMTAMPHAARWPEAGDHESVAPAQPKPETLPGYWQGYVRGRSDGRSLYVSGWRRGAWQGALAGATLVMLIVEGTRWLA